MMRTILIGDTETCISELQEVYTHGGKFHADDVCTVALLRFFGFNGKVNRVFKISDELKESGALIFDIGGGEFDHHSNVIITYEDGCPMAAFGKVARNIRVDGVELENLFPGFTDEIAKPIEAHDNGYSSDSIPQSYFAKICNVFVPAWNEEINMDFAFERAVDLCYEVLRRQLIHLSSKQVAAIEIQKAKVIDNVIILEKFVPWQDHIDDNIRLQSSRLSEGVITSRLHQIKTLLLELSRIRLNSTSQKSRRPFAHSFIQQGSSVRPIHLQTPLS